jgi:glucosamine--fructose-6-phosphate aminotransferase (isomerizing)
VENNDDPGPNKGTLSKDVTVKSNQFKNQIPQKTRLTKAPRRRQQGIHDRKDFLSILIRSIAPWQAAGDAPAVSVHSGYGKRVIRWLRRIHLGLRHYLLKDVYLGKSMENVPENTIVLFPCRNTMVCCGIAGIVGFKQKSVEDRGFDASNIESLIDEVDSFGYTRCRDHELFIADHYLGGDSSVQSLTQAIRELKSTPLFFELLSRQDAPEVLSQLTGRLQTTIESEGKELSNRMGFIPASDLDIISRRIEELKDCAWCLGFEISENLKKINTLIGRPDILSSVDSVDIFKKLNAVLNSIDRLEVRGRDSAGISLMFIFDGAEFDRFRKTLESENLLSELTERSSRPTLVNNGITVHRNADTDGNNKVAITLVYKTAAEVGRLGDNVGVLRDQIRNDPILHLLAGFSNTHYTVNAHTRWASVGAISEPNCHPVDNRGTGDLTENQGIIHVCLNGDIDNFMDLKADYESTGNLIHKDITTDTKIIPLQIETYIHQGHEVEDAFRLAVNDFKGSHAISMHTDLAPGKLFLAQKGSGQSLFVGLGDDHCMPTSEVYGFVEETPVYLKMDGEKIVEGNTGKTQGQIFILSQDSGRGIDGIRAMYYDGTPIELSESDLKHTAITSRDIDRQRFPHYFLKEISESPASVEKTLHNRWKIKDGPVKKYEITLDEKVVPKSLQDALTGSAEVQIKRIFFIGQGTAGVAAQVCSDILNFYMDDPSLRICALKASELSGFTINETDTASAMSDALVIAISQSGTTTDTNRTVDMVKERGAHTVAIVNRRDSDITFRVDGVMYTSSGRDIEMSVASTKAFYSQITAGALIGLCLVRLKNRRSDDFVSDEIKQLLNLPAHMKKVLSMKSQFESSASRLAVTKTYWAAVGSGPNKASADEIRIKLSELCYKTISSDYVEDKKHIDLSSEPLIFVCAGGTKGNVIGDIIKDTAIFQAHKAAPVVIADEGETRFEPYAADVFYVPRVSEHLAPILNTLAGHIWGYYAALAINEGSRFMYDFREEIQNTLETSSASGLDVYELLLEKTFREKVARFYNDFRRKKAQNRFPSTMGLGAASDLILLLKYLLGRLPVSDFELDFDIKGTASNMLNHLFKCLGAAIDSMARPVDAIKHQAKTVTVGTSRISEAVEGLLFEALAANNFNIAQLINRNIIVLKNLQNIVSKIEGSTLYRIDRLNLLGEPTDETTIEVKKKEGSLKSVLSRVEKDNKLKGTKRIIVREGNVYIGKGRKDDRSIIIVPILSASPATPNVIEYLLLMNILFKEDVPLHVKIKALGGKHERIKNIVQESSSIWDDNYLELIDIEELFGKSAEKLGEFIVSHLGG